MGGNNDQVDWCGHLRFGPCNVGTCSTPVASSSTGRHHLTGPPRMRRWQGADQWCLCHPALRVRIRPPLLWLWVSAIQIRVLRLVVSPVWILRSSTRLLAWSRVSSLALMGMPATSIDRLRMTHDDTGCSLSGRQFEVCGNCLGGTGALQTPRSVSSRIDVASIRATAFRRSAFRPAAPDIS
jgi:hypothetical protein